MAIGNYFLNAPTLASATAVFTNSDMTICAPDGFYQQDNIVRELSGCVLLPQQVCPSCASECGGVIIGGTANGLSAYKMNVDLNTGTGAVIVKVNVSDIPSGVIAEFNSVFYNALSSPTYGYLAAPPSQVTYIGKSSEDCGIVQPFPYTLVPYTLEVFRYNGLVFESSPAEVDVIYTDFPQLQLTTNNPGQCIMVIPKTITSPTVVEVTIITLCPNATFTVEVECPANLQAYDSSERYSSSVLACGSALTPKFVAHVNGSAGTLGLYDWVFSDINGQIVLPDGYYYAPVAVPVSQNWYRVANGIVVQFGTC